LGDKTFVVQLSGYLVGYAIDVAILVLLLRVLSGVDLPWAVLRQSALVGGLLLTVVKVFGAQLIANATKSPLLGSVVVVVGLLFWLNLIARIVILTAAWAAVTMADRAGAEEPEGSADDRPIQHTAVRVIPPATANAGVVGAPVTRERDRVAITAGAVLGAAAATAVAGAIRRWARRS
jgi:membrane protein